MTGNGCAIWLLPGGAATRGRNIYDDTLASRFGDNAATNAVWIDNANRREAFPGGRTRRVPSGRRLRLSVHEKWQKVGCFAGRRTSGGSCGLESSQAHRRRFVPWPFTEAPCGAGGGAKRETVRLAPGTIARTYRELELAGLVRTGRARGTVVIDTAAIDPATVLRDLARTYATAAQALGADTATALDAVRAAYRG